jgi:hypothetical protein
LQPQMFLIVALTVLAVIRCLWAGGLPGATGRGCRRR